MLCCRRSDPPAYASVDWCVIGFIVNLPTLAVMTSARCATAAKAFSFRNMRILQVVRSNEGVLKSHGLSAHAATSKDWYRINLRHCNPPRDRHGMSRTSAHTRLATHAAPRHAHGGSKARTTHHPCLQAAISSTRPSCPRPPRLPCRRWAPPPSPSLPWAAQPPPLRLPRPPAACRG